MAALNKATNKVGLQSLDPELAVLLNRVTDDSNVESVIVYYQAPATPTSPTFNVLVF